MNRIKKILCILLVIPLLFSCSVQDDRELCCDGNTLRFRYLYRESDRFHTYIDKVSYYLFDAKGKYLKELPPKVGSKNKVDISELEYGKYTMIAVGNSYGSGVLEGYLSGGLEGFLFRLSNFRADIPSTLKNTDRLYWGEKSFEVKHRSPNSYIGEMSNIHCVLRVRVEWEGTPKYSTGYGLSLSGVGKYNEFTGKHGYDIGVHRFPLVKEYKGRILEDVSLRQFSLNATLISLRWTDDNMPNLNICHDGIPVSKTVRLGEIFPKWGWYPSRDEVQEYEIRLRVHLNGTIEVSQGLGVGVSDWIDGGSFS